MPSQNLKDKVVVLIGATSGIGEQTALVLAARGAKIVIAGRRQARGDAVAAASKAAGASDALFVKTDVTSSQEVEALFQQSIKTFGGVDAVFVNAGVFPQADFLADDSALHTLVDVNIKGTTYAVRHAVNALRERGTNGALILTSSIVGSFPVGGGDAFGPISSMAVYNATKSYVDSLARSLTAVREIRSYTIAPSVYATDMTKGTNAVGFAQALHAVYKLPGNPTDIGRIVEGIVDGTTAWESGSLIAAEGPFTYDGHLRYSQVYDPASRGKPGIHLSLSDLRDTHGRPAGVQQSEVDALLKEAAATTASTSTEESSHAATAE